MSPELLFFYKKLILNMIWTTFKTHLLWTISQVKLNPISGLLKAKQLNFEFKISSFRSIHLHIFSEIGQDCKYSIWTGRHSPPSPDYMGLSTLRSRSFFDCLRPSPHSLKTKTKNLLFCINGVKCLKLIKTFGCFSCLLGVAYDSLSKNNCEQGHICHFWWIFKRIHLNMF